MTAVDSASSALPYTPDIPMHPSPIAETLSPLLPNDRVCIWSSRRSPTRDCTTDGMDGDLERASSPPSVGGPPAQPGATLPKATSTVGVKGRGNDFPDDVVVHPEIVVNNLVPHAHDFGPRDVRVRGAEGRRDTFGRLANDLAQMCECEAKILVVIEISTSLPVHLVDRLACHLEHVADIDGVIRRHTGLQRR